MTEAPILNAILEYLQIMRIFHYRNNSGAAKANSGHFIRFGTPGSPDIVLVIRGMYVGLEVKRPGGKLNPNQQLFKESLEKAGGKYFLVTSVDDVIKAIKSL